MVWINSSPALEVAFSTDEAVIKAIQVPHAPLFIILTRSQLLVQHNQTLLPLASHKRNEQSINQHGENVDIKLQLISVNTSKLLQSRHSNIFVRTSTDYLHIYQLQAQLLNPLFEIIGNHSDETLQSGFPMCITKSLFSMSSLIKSATKSIIVGNDQEVNLENIEHFGNLQIEDEENSLTIPQINLSIHKILKVSIGITDFWLQNNSHNLFIYNDKKFQTLNLKTMAVTTIHFNDLDWFKQIEDESSNDITDSVNSNPEAAKDSKPIKLHYNEYFHYFILETDQRQLWKLVMTDEIIQGVQVNEFEKPKDLNEHGDHNQVEFHFNPQCNLAIASSEKHLSLYRFDEHGKFIRVKSISNQNHEFTNIKSLQWSPDGEFFGIIDNDIWLLFSKFGNCHFNSLEILKESKILSYSSISHLNFLKASQFFITSNCKSLILVGSNELYLFNILLLVNNKNSSIDCEISNLISFSSEYLSVIDEKQHSLLKFPILPHFKKIIRKLDYSNPFTTSHKALSGKLTISASKNYQFCMTYGDKISVSTPFQTGWKVNHIIWFNFHNFFLESLNIVNHIWTQNDQLIAINRQYNEKSDTLTLLDEIIVLDVSQSKYGHGGIGFQFTSDRIIWRYSLGNKVIAFDYNKDGNLITLTDDFKCCIFKFAKNDNNALSVELSTKIDLKMISTTLNILDIVQIKMIGHFQFLLLLNTGEFYILKSKEVTNENNRQTMFDLILINPHIEFLGIFELDDQLLYLFNGDAILIYKIKDILNINTVGSLPIIIPNNYEYFQPILMSISYNPEINESINLIGLENFSSLKGNKILQLKTRVNHKTILNNFIEYYMINQDFKRINNLQKSFENYNYSLELLLFKYLTNLGLESDSLPDSKTEKEIAAESLVNTQLLKSIINLINNTAQPESIYVNCLRKVEVGYWSKFFETLETTPLEFMDKLIQLGNEQLCHNYLIIYLNFKKEHESNATAIDKADQDIILKILNMLAKANRWNWCFELCRFIKLLEPSSEFLKRIEKSLQKS